MSQNGTLTYYEQYAKLFFDDTVNVEFDKVRNRFLDKLEQGACILDFGCGSGRDTKYFLEHGYRVDAIDGSEKLCKLASEYTGIKIRHMLFQDLCGVELYDGIWACSSILHLSKEELVEVIRKMDKALKGGGVIYTSFKYGEFEGERNGRYFTDMTEERFSEILERVGSLAVEEEWVSGDARKGREKEGWLNLILRKENVVRNCS